MGAPLRGPDALVYFFDEIDELLVSRDRAPERTQSIFSFLTPSFLTKIQDLREEADRKSYIFVVGTNYFDRIDEAAKRRERIDRQFMVIYPDRASRVAIARAALAGKRLEFLAGAGEKEGEELVGGIGDASELFSYNMLVDLCKWIVTQNERGQVERRLKTIMAGADSVFRPEVDLSFYARRAHALNEFLDVVSLTPRRHGNRAQAFLNYWRSLLESTRTILEEQTLRTLEDRNFTAEELAAVRAGLEITGAAGGGAPRV